MARVGKVGKPLEILRRYKLAIILLIGLLVAGFLTYSFLMVGSYRVEAGMME